MRSGMLLRLTGTGVYLKDGMAVLNVRNEIPLLLPDRSAVIENCDTQQLTCIGMGFFFSRCVDPMVRQTVQKVRNVKSIVFVGKNQSTKRIDGD